MQIALKVQIIFFKSSVLHHGFTRLDGLVVWVCCNKRASIEGYRQSVALVENHVHHGSALWLGLDHTL